jgi:RNA polymerase sigma factor for flagellar operon FliA
MNLKDRRQRQRSAPGFRSRRGDKRVEGLTRAELVRKYEPKVKFIASRLASQLPESVEIDDLVSVGFIGLMDAADKFKESRGVKFSTYAEFRIRGAILDELRNQDWLPHCARSKAKEIDHTYGKLEQETGRRPTESEVSARLGLRRERFQKIKDRVASFTVVHCEDPDELEQRTEAPGEESNPFNTVLRKNVSDFLSELFKTLADEERVVLSCYYFRGLNLREIAEILSVTESRVSQIHTKAIFNLKQLLREQERANSESMFHLLLEAA